ncbi:MAG: Asp-tRNA(Asn)/Glu-tRNA(Gln) amidotransferase subunit GatB, partial [Gallicola sp.]|nr:Asp-tRNA(Asn)/Glu-tRNA(Gln) amidotransferase subunit GatB [Gallicola sp.]
MSLKTLIGLEIHVELATETKMFCGCKNEFGKAPNTNVCPICLGHPGALPAMNKKAVEYGVMAGLAFDCTIRKDFKMDRKKYFYPDLTKGYQITQEDFPLCSKGKIEIKTENGTKDIGIHRIHIEEDTGKSIHNEEGNTLMDYNRCGVPLIEIVTEPDMESAEEARQFLDILKERIKYLGISDVKMEEGSLRCDCNLNVVDEEKGFKTKISEIKNMNSFRAVEKAIEYET